MKIRIISGVVGAIVLILVLLSDTIVLNIGIAITAFIALFELYSACGLAKHLPLMLLGFGASIAFTYAQAFSNRLLLPAIYIYILLLFVAFMLFKNRIRFGDISKMFFTTVYICLLFGHIVFVRRMPNGQFAIWFIFICAFLTDTFALFGGKLFGKRKLCPSLSPKKTVEGSITGIIGSLIGMLVYGMVLQVGFHFTVNYFSAAVLGILGSIVAQLGDLAASCIKREYALKDYGKIMPGHGGVMDRFDSVIFVAPLVFYYLWLFPVI